MALAGASELGQLMAEFEGANIGKSFSIQKRVNFCVLVNSTSNLEKVDSCRDGLLQNGGPVAVFCGTTCNVKSLAADLMTCFSSCKNFFSSKGNEIVNTLCKKDQKCTGALINSKGHEMISPNSKISTSREPDEDGPY